MIRRGGAHASRRGGCPYEQGARAREQEDARVHPPFLCPFVPVRMGARVGEWGHPGGVQSQWRRIATPFPDLRAGVTHNKGGIGKPWALPFCPLPRPLPAPALTHTPLCADPRAPPQVHPPQGRRAPPLLPPLCAAPPTCIAPCACVHRQGPRTSPACTRTPPRVRAHHPRPAHPTLPCPHAKCGQGGVGRVRAGAHVRKGEGSARARGRGTCARGEARAHARGRRTRTLGEGASAIKPWRL